MTANSTKYNAAKVNASGMGLAEYIREDLKHLNAKKRRTLLVFDTETTGTDEDAEIVQFSAEVYKLRDHGKTINRPTPGRGFRKPEPMDPWEYGKAARFDRFYKPEHHDSWDEASEVTGIWPEDVEDCPAFQDPAQLAAVQELFDQADVIVGHNVGFDLRRVERWGIRVREDAVVVDTMYDYSDYRKGNALETEQVRRTLTCAAGYFGYRFDAHNSANDTAATFRVFCGLFDQDAITARTPSFVIDRYDRNSARIAKRQATIDANMAAGVYKERAAKEDAEHMARMHEALDEAAKAGQTESAAAEVVA